MSGVRHLQTNTLTNQDISTALLLDTYTAAADRLIACQIFADQIAGNDNYVVYTTLQIAGAGSAYRIGPITTDAVASGVTANGWYCGPFLVRNTDVVKVYLTGAAGDTTTVDTTVRWYEVSALQPTTADRTLDVAATGEAGLDFDNINAATGATTLTNVTVPTVTSVTNSVGVSGDFSATMKASITAAVPTSTDNASAVWDEPLSGYTTAGSAGYTLTNAGSAGDPWSAATRTLTQTAAQVAAAVDGATINMRRGDTLSASLTGLGDLLNLSELYFTVKADETDADSASLIQIGQVAGLLYLNGSTDIASSDGSITIDSSSDGNVTIALTAANTANLKVGTYKYDMQLVRSSGTPVSTLTVGSFQVSPDYTLVTT